MIYFASSLTEILPILSIVGAMLAGFFAIAKIMLTQATNDREADRNERKVFAAAIERMASATERTAQEAKERNGHLADISIDNKDAILTAIKEIKFNQKIQEQSVEHQVVNNKE